jgi:hypothetical protein
MKGSGTKGRKAKSSSSPAKRKAAPKRATPKRAAARKPPPRADFGAPVEGFFARQPPHLRAILEELPREAVRGWLRMAASLAQGG